MARLISHCPVCGDALKITVLKCSTCGMELRNDFELSPFDHLSQEQYTFLMTFLRCQGNLSALQTEMGLSYPAAKKQLSELLAELGVGEVSKEKIEIPDMSDWVIDSSSTRASEIVKAKLMECGGKAAIQTLTGITYHVWVVDDQSFGCDIAPTLEYRIFDVIADLLASQGGRAKKGNGRAALGDPGCEDSTIAGAIIKQYYHKTIGEKAFDPGFVMLAILEWAGILYNRRGYAELTPDYRVRLDF